MFSGKVSDLSKLARLTHGDSLDDVEGFPEDHVTDYSPRLPHIQEIRYENVSFMRKISIENLD